MNQSINSGKDMGTGALILAREWERQDCCSGEGMREECRSIYQQGVGWSRLCLPHISVPTGPWQDCAEAHRSGHRQSGVYELRLGRHVGSAWCEQQLEGGGWTVIQRRQDGSVNFFTTWQHYKVGVGGQGQGCVGEGTCF